MRERSQKGRRIEISASEKRGELSILDQYGQAMQDQAMLEAMYKAVVEDPSTLGFNMEGVVRRSLRRAELEAEELKRRYEDNEER